MMMQEKGIRRIDAGRGRRMTLLFGVFAIVLLLMGVSCEGNTIKDGITNVSITITEEKLLEHSYIDGIASYDYKAVCNSHTPAQGETEGFVPLFVDGTGRAELGHMENGDWTFTVRAFNSHGVQLYEGTVKKFVSGNDLNVPVVLALRKVGTGTARFTITGRCSGAESFLAIYWKSYDGNVNGSSRAFETSCDGDIDTYTGSVTLPENRYAITVEVYTADAVLATDITDVLILADDEITITGVLDGQEDQTGTIKPIEPKKPYGHIEITGKLKSGQTVTATWVQDGETAPERLCWYMDGTEYLDHGASISIVLPSPGMHYLTATATAGTESCSDGYPLDLASDPIKPTGGLIVYDRGEAYGTYWFDEYQENYRVDDEGAGWRYIVAKVVDTGAGTAASPLWTLATSAGALAGSTSANVGQSEAATQTLMTAMGSSVGTYTSGGKTYRPAPAGIMDGWFIPTKAEATYILSAMRSGKMTKTKFWTSTQYSSSMAYLADPTANSVSATNKTTGAGLVLIKYI